MSSSVLMPWAGRATKSPFAKAERHRKITSAADDGGREIEHDRAGDPRRTDVDVAGRRRAWER